MPKIYLIFLAVMSVITFFAYLIDKLKAKTDSFRIPEKVLLLLTFLGGSIGALISSRLFHHKTKKIYFTIVIYLSLIIHVLICLYLFQIIKF